MAITTGVHLPIQASTPCGSAVQFPQRPARFGSREGRRAGPPCGRAVKIRGARGRIEVNRIGAGLHSLPLASMIALTASSHVALGLACR